MADYSKIAHLKDLNTSMFNERMNRAYDYGYEDGLARGTECGYKRGYENGQKLKQTEDKQTEKSCDNCSMQHKCAGFIYGNYWCWRSKQTEDDKQDKENKTLIKIKSHNFVGKQYVLYEDVLDLIRQIKEKAND